MSKNSRNTKAFRKTVSNRMNRPDRAMEVANGAYRIEAFYLSVNKRKGAE